MTFYYFTEELRRALENLNLNYLTEIRLRNGQPVIIRFRGEYNYINSFGITSDCDNAKPSFGYGAGVICDRA